MLNGFSVAALSGGDASGNVTGRMVRRAPNGSRTFRNLSWRTTGSPVSALLALIMCGCAPDGNSDEPGKALPDAPIYQALSAIALDPTALSVPKLGPMAVSGAARLPVVDRLMSDPLEMRHLAHRMVVRAPQPGQMREYLAGLLGDLGTIEFVTGEAPRAVDALDDAWRAAREGALAENVPPSPPKSLVENRELAAAIASLIGAASVASNDMRAMLALTGPEWKTLAPVIREKLAYRGEEQNARWLTEKIFHTVGARVSAREMTASLVELAAAAETVHSRTSRENWPAGEWMTPLGRLRVGTRNADHYEGEYFAILDPGGDDTYDDVSSPLLPGAVLIVADLDGNDTVHWNAKPGPGAGILGYGVWLDMAGDDSYIGNNLGAGAAALGAGMLWDASGNDRYEGGSLVQGAAHYGIAILFDGAGSDAYRAGLSAQGFGGPAGYGLLIDGGGDDRYACGNLSPDRMEARRARHGAQHFLSMCQGFAFGFRPEVSGGFGVLLDRAGNDEYRADIFGQGAALWFGVGSLADLSGNDRYEAFEHCQGESVHLGAGFLGDWGGDDRYTGFEHCQGVGVDRAAGFLYDQRGDDSYSAERDAQGVALKAYAVGILWDESGTDRYAAAESAQGFAALVDPISEDQLGVGILLDEGKGKDVFELPETDRPGRRPRIRNRQGIVVNR
jgi:hypothetical protein